MKAGKPPLPLINKVVDGYLPLLNYQLNETNAESLSRATLDLVPDLINKLYMVHNSLKDPGTAKLFSELSKTVGLRGVGIIGNAIGP